MKNGPLPSLADLVPNEPVVRCQACGELVLGAEACTSATEARACMGGESDAGREVTPWQ